MTDDREPPREDNPLGAIIDPLAQVGIDTARDLAAALQSTRAAGRDLWRLVNVLNRVPRRDQGTQQNSIPAAPGPAEAPTAGHTIDDDENSDRADTFPNNAELVADPGPTAPTDTGIVGGLKRAAGTILNPAAVLGVAVAPVRRIVGPGGRTDNPTDSDTKLRSIGDQLITASQQPVAKPSRRHPAFGARSPTRNTMGLMAPRGFWPCCAVKGKRYHARRSQRSWWTTGFKGSSLYMASAYHRCR